MLFVLPKIIKGSYYPNTTETFLQANLCQLRNTTTSQLCSSKTTPTIYMVIFFAAQIVMGLGATPLFSLGAAYLDENVSPVNSPIYIGTWYLCTFLGPALGYFIAGKMLNSYTNIGIVST